MIILTGSRGGFVGLVSAGVLFVYRRRGLGAAVGVLALLVITVIAVPTELSNRALSTITGDVSGRSSAEQTELKVSNAAHVGLFWAALRMIAENPVMGVGPLNFKDLSTTYTGLPTANIAHNMFLEIGAEMGLPVLVIFILILTSTFRDLGLAVRTRGTAPAQELAGWAEGLRSGLAGYVVSGCFISAEYEKILWIAVFLSIVVGDLVRRHRAAMAAELEAQESSVQDVGGVLPQPS